MVSFDGFRITFCILWYIEAIYKYKAVDKVIDKLKAINRYSIIYVGFIFVTLSFIYSLIECIYLILKRRSYSLRKKCPYSELFCPYFPRIFMHSDSVQRDTSHLSVFSWNAGKCGKNVDQNNSKYGHFLHSVFFFCVVSRLSSLSSGDCIMKALHQWLWSMTG